MIGDSEKKEHLAKFNASTAFYAACESGHFFWAGPDRSTYADAAKDARDHDSTSHGGSPTAVVLNA